MIRAGRPGGDLERNGAPGAPVARENAFAAAKRGSNPGVFES